MIRGLLGGALIAWALASCMVVKGSSTVRLTGTCDGACDHYMQCKPGHSSNDGTRCRNECPSVFSDRESLMMYESLSCRDAVEYIDGTGTATRAATTAPKSLTTP